MHDDLKQSMLWYDEAVERHFIGKLEEQQFPPSCTANHWMAYQPMQSGLLSCVHIFTAVLMMGLMKGVGHTVIPVGYLSNALPESPTYDGCGDKKEKHLGCFFNLTSCKVEEDGSRHEALMRKSSSAHPLGDKWVDFMKSNTTPGGLSVVVNWVWAPFVEDNVRVEKGSLEPKVLLWNEVREHGSAGVYGMPEEALDHVWAYQVEFAFSSMLSSWMLKQTTSRVKELADQIMAKYSDASGRPLWKAPVVTVHIRQTDKSAEDPYFEKHKRYRNTTDYVAEVVALETKYNFTWPSVFLISDSGSAMESFARAANGAEGPPDSANAQAGKRFIMYDWTDDSSLLERTGGHLKVPQERKRAAQEHFLATLYIIESVSDFAIVAYSSNVGRFVSELIGARHRVACSDELGPNALSLDYHWKHD